MKIRFLNRFFAAFMAGLIVLSDSSVYGAIVSQNDAETIAVASEDDETVSENDVLELSDEETGEEEDDELAIEQVNKTVNPDKAKLFNPSHKHSADWEQDGGKWSCIYFGTYPQGVFRDTSVINQIDAQLRTNDRYPDTFYTGDATINGVRYRKVNVNTTKADSFYAGKISADGRSAAAYFRFDPIKWRVLSIDEANNKLTIMADKILNERAYTGGT